MRVGPFWQYYGGKWRAAPRYPAPECNTIVEPFAGAAGYSCLYPRHQVHLYDVDEHVVGTWRYLLSTPADEIRRIPDVPEGGTVDDLPAWVPQEARWLVGWWCNAATTHPSKRPSAWATTHPDQWRSWADVRERCARGVEQIRHWTIERRPWWDLSELRATWFVDPPYSTAAGRRYRHDYVDFAALAAWCKSRRGQVIVCEQEGADWLPFRPFGHVKGQAKAGGSDRRNLEVIWTRGVGEQMRLMEAIP